VKQLELLGKRLLRQTLRVVIHGGRRQPTEIDPDKIRKILVVRQDNRIGNLVLQIPFIKGLRHTFPQADITALLGATLAELYTGVPEITDRFIYRHRELARHPWKWLPFVRQLGKGGWDVAFECGHPEVVSLNNASLTYLSKAPFRVGFDRGDADVFLNVLCPASRRLHYARAMTALLAPWRRDSAELEMSLPLPDRHRNAHLRVWGRSNLDSDARVVLIWAGGRHDKQWNSGFWREIARAIASTFSNALIPVIGLGPGEVGLAAKFVGFTALKTAVFDGPVEELWAFLDHCHAVVSGDTGPMHLAVALGVPTLALFRVDNVWEYGHDDGKWHRAMLVRDLDPIPSVVEFLKAIPKDTCPRSTISY